MNTTKKTSVPMIKVPIIENSLWSILENFGLGFFPWILVYIIIFPKSTGWLTFSILAGIITGGFLLWKASYQVKEYYYHVYYFFGKLVGMPKPGLFIRKLAGLGSEIITLIKSIFTVSFKETVDIAELREIADALRKNDFRKLAKYHVFLDITASFRLAPWGVGNYITYAGKELDPQKVSEMGWMKHVLSDIATTLALITLVRGYWYMRIHADWKAEDLEQEVEEVKNIIRELGVNELIKFLDKGVESLQTTLAHYGIELVSLNVEIDVPEEMRKVNMQKYLIEAGRKARLLDARIKAKEVEIAAKAEAVAKKIKAKAEAEAKATLDRRLADEFEKTVNMLKEHGVPDTVAAEFAMLIHDIVKNEYYVRLSGVEGLSKAGGIIAEAISKKLPKATKAVAEDYKKRLQQKSKKKPPRK